MLHLQAQFPPGDHRTLRWRNWWKRSVIVKWSEIQKEENKNKFLLIKLIILSLCRLSIQAIYLIEDKPPQFQQNFAKHVTYFLDYYCSGNFSK